jgi:hypothetical protein
MEDKSGCVAVGEEKKVRWKKMNTVGLMVE